MSPGRAPAAGLRAAWFRAGLVVATWIGISGAPMIATAADAARVEAAYVLNFVRYSRWPDHGSAPIVIGVLGTPDAGNALRDLARRAGSLEGRPVTVRMLPLASYAPAAAEATRALSATAAGAQVLYVSESHRSWSRAVAAVASGKPVLTVGTGRAFLAEGGMLALYRDGPNVRFAVNAPAIKASRVDVSARLLVLARPAGGG